MCYNVYKPCAIFVFQGKSDETNVGELLNKFNCYLEASFHFEFPFFLILVYRLNKFVYY